MKKALLILATITMLWQCALAQGPQEGVARLNNGSVVAGLIAKSNTADRYRVTMPDGSFLYFGGNELRSLEWGKPGYMATPNNAGGEAITDNTVNFVQYGMNSSNFDSAENDWGTMKSVNVQSLSPDAAQKLYISGRNQARVGRVFLILGIVGTVGGIGVAMSADGDRNIALVGAWGVIGSQLFMAIGIPALAAGVTRKNYALRQMRAVGMDDMPNKPSPHFQLNLNTDGMGLAYVF